MLLSGGDELSYLKSNDIVFVTSDFTHFLNEENITHFYWGLGELGAELH